MKLIDLRSLCYIEIVRLGPRIIVHIPVVKISEMKQKGHNPPPPPPPHAPPPPPI